MRTEMITLAHGMSPCSRSVLTSGGGKLLTELGHLLRHFVKEDLPRIRYANPAIDIEVTKMLKSKEDTWKPEMLVELSALSFFCTLATSILCALWP